ncbi:MAG: 4-hydroxy-tetrahydrodipicolinate reductase [Fluviicola sp.]
MRIGLIGYGKMGKAIERIALERGHSIAYKINSENPITSQDLNLADVAIEFTQPALAVSHIHACLDANLPVVIGTTAWQEHLPSVKSAVEAKNGSLLYASNFSVGVNILFQINERLAQLMSKQPDYKASIEEIHHTQKLDAPSGTAVTIAEGILANHSGYRSWVSALNESPAVNDGQLPIKALREPDVPGTHTIEYHSAIDTISLTHIAHSRDGFALGAVIAAEFLADKKGIFTMRDVLAL